MLISGGGTTLANLIANIQAGQLDARIERVISSNPAAAGLRFAHQAEIRTAVLEGRAFADEAAYSQAVFDECRAAEVDLVVMGGFLKHVLIPADFENRVVNIHPALIPAFCGQGFYGHRVHEAVLEAGARVSGCTVHFVDNIYDHGPVILQRHRAGPRRRHARPVGRPRFRRRVRGLSRSTATDRQRQSHDQCR